MASLLERSQVAKREDLLDLLTRVDEKATPFMSLVNKGTTPQNTRMDWPVDAYASPSLGGIVDGKDITETGGGDYENPAGSRALLFNYLQTFRRAAMISRLAGDVSVIAGVADEKANAVAVKGVELLRDMETTMLSDQEFDTDDGTNPYLLRAMGVWVRGDSTINTAGFGSLAGQSSGFEVPAAFRPADGQINGDATADLTESDIQTMLQTIWTNTGMIGDYKLFCDATLRRAFTDFTRTIATAGYSQRNLNYDGDGTKITNTTTIFEGDFGQVEVIADNFIGANRPGVTFAQEAGRGYLLDMDKIDVRLEKSPTVETFEDRGGGERIMIEGRATLQVRNPKGLGQFSPAL